MNRPATAHGTIPAPFTIRGVVVKFVRGKTATVSDIPRQDAHEIRDRLAEKQSRPRVAHGKGLRDGDPRIPFDIDVADTVDPHSYDEHIKHPSFLEINRQPARHRNDRCWCGDKATIDEINTADGAIIRQVCEKHPTPTVFDLIVGGPEDAA